MSDKGRPLVFIAIGATVVAIAAAQFFMNKSKQGQKAEDKKPDTRIMADKDEVSSALCSFVADSAKAAIASRGVFHLSVAGGSLLDTLAKLSEHKDAVDFSKVVLSFANHKCVSPEDEKATLAKSKKKFATAIGITRFVAPAPIPQDGGDGSKEAEFYAQALKDAGVPHKDGYPVIDLILLGLGADGHVGSCHPMGPAVKETTKAVAGSPKSGEPSSITFTIETMNSANCVGVVVVGGSKGKKEAVKRALTRPAEEPRGTFPAQSLKAPIFFLDKEAAADL